MKYFSKRGELTKLSLILLIASLILIIGVVLWIFLRNGSSKEDYALYDSNLDLKISQVQKVDDSKLNVEVRVNSGERKFVALSFSASDGSTTEVIRINSSIPGDEEGNFSLNFVVLNASKVNKITVTPIYETKSGEEIIGTTKDEYLSPACFPSCPYGAQCGNNGCGGNCGSGCASGYLCVDHKCIKQSSGGGSSGGGSSTPSCTDTCSSLGYACGTQTVCAKSTNCGSCGTGYYCNSGNCSLCTTHATSNCSNGDVYWWNSCGVREEIRYDCLVNQTCSAGACVDCTAHATSNCSNGDVYWWNSCGVREEIRYDCLVNQTCSAGACVDCTAHATSNCSNGDVYWWNSCGVREEIRYDCNATQTCSSGTCVNNPVNPPSTGAIIADHTIVDDFDIIPSCWIEAAKEYIVMGYGHTSHGSQITTGLDMVLSEHGNLYSFNNGGTDGALDYEEGDGYGEGWLDHDVGYGGWDVETRDYLDGSDPGAGTADHSDVNTIMWSWCGQVSGYTTYNSMSEHYLAPAESIVDDYQINFVYMTGHLDGGGPTGSVYTANNIIRQHVRDINGTLLDFADIESYSPDGTYYPTASDDCAWCSTWCASHDCPSCGSCAHSHCFNCYNKGKAFWWMVARMAGWDGTAGDACP